MRVRRALVIGGAVLALVLALAAGFTVLLARDVGAEVPAGRNYEVQTRLTGAELVASEGDAGLRLNFESKIGSTEVPGFRQTQDLDRIIGVEAARTGGIHDWTLFRTIDTWPKPLRVAYLSYIATRGNPDVQYASTLRAGGWPGAWWSEPGPDRERALEIGERAGFSDRDLVWTEYWASNAFTGELLGYDSVEGRLRLLAAGADIEHGTTDRLRVVAPTAP